MTKELFRLIRVEKRLNQRQFAERLGVSSALVAMIESGKRDVSKRTAAKIVHALGLTESDFDRLAELRAMLSE